MPTVLMISYSGALGGAERILLDCADALAGERNLACPEGELARGARARGIRVLPLPGRSLALRGSALEPVKAFGRLAAHGREARRLIGDLDPDLVLAWGMRSALACLAGRSAQAPIVFQHNDLLPGPLIGRIVRLAAARAKLVLALSHAIAADLDPEESLADRLRIVHPGVDVEKFNPTSRPARPPEILVLGALVPWKRPELALEAVALARLRQPELRLRLVGAPFAEDGDALATRLRERAAEADLAEAVELVGALADPRAELERATCLLHCATREPFGMAVLEALAAARPAVVPEAAGPAEIVDPSCGRLYPPGDARAAADALVEIVADAELAAEMGANGRRRARDQFGLARSQARFAEAVQQVSRPPRAPVLAAEALEIVTVTHNSAPELERLLASVRRHLPGSRTVVVDSGSQDESLAVARAAESTTVIDLEANVGFGTACNAGLQAVQEPLTALLNPDVELVDDSLLRLASSHLARGMPARLLAPRVLLPDGRRQDNVHPMPASGADLARALIAPGLLPRPLALALAPWRAERPRRVGWAVGCAVLARTETFRALGPFDERFFLYGEDLDLGLHASERGIETWFHPEARVLHERAHASARSFGGEPFSRLAHARDEAVLRRLGASQARVDRGAQALTFLSRALAKRALGLPAKREWAQLKAVLALRRPK